MKRTLQLGLVAFALAGSLGAAIAWAAKSSTKVKGLGSAEVTWNAVPFREELMQQLSPGLTWRLGSGDATRLELSGMALVNGSSMLFPGEATLNLRYWSDIRWDLVVFAENHWSWSADKTELALVPAKVGKNPDKKAHAKKLELELRAVTKATQSEVPVPAVTGLDEDLLDPDEVDDDVGYSGEARKEFDAIPVLELHMRFGPHMGIVAFEAVKWEELTAKAPPRKKDGDADGATSDKARKLRLRIASHPAVQARTELLDKHEGQLTLGTWEDGAPGDKPVVLVMTGGELPMLWPITRAAKSKDDTARAELDPIEGKRVPKPGKDGKLPKPAKTLNATLAGNVLTVHLHGVDYVFEL